MQMNDHSIRPTVSFQNDLTPTEVVDTPNHELTIVTYPVLSLPSEFVAEIFTNFLPTYSEPPSTWMVRTMSISPYGSSHESILFPFQLELEFGASRKFNLNVLPSLSRFYGRLRILPSFYSIFGSTR
jgi:hypothetical protein